MIARMRKWISAFGKPKEHQDKPILRILIQKHGIESVKWIIREMNKEYGESHTLCIEVRF